MLLGQKKLGTHVVVVFWVVRKRGREEERKRGREDERDDLFTALTAQKG